MQSYLYIKESIVLLLTKTIRSVSLKTSSLYKSITLSIFLLFVSTIAFANNTTFNKFFTNKINILKDQLILPENLFNSCSSTIASIDIPKTISATVASTVTSEIPIAANGVITDVNLINLDITHEYLDDIIVTLSSPNGTDVIVVSRPCGSAQNVALSLDDAAASGTLPCPPTDGLTYQPANALSLFNGEPITGTWTLSVQDIYGALDGGSLNGWSLELTYTCVGTEICDNNIDDDGDGLIDCADSDCPNSCASLNCNDGVTLIASETASAVGSGNSGIPSINNFYIPAGNNRVVFVIANFEREHCQSGDNCTNSNTTGTGLGDNFASPNFLSGDPQLMVRFAGNTSMDKKNPLNFPDGDLRFLHQTAFPTPPDASSASFYSRESYFIALYESDINTILGGSATGNITLTLPDVNTPLDNADEALLIAYVFANVKQDASGIVRSGVNTSENYSNSESGGINGDFTITDSNLDDGQEPDEAGDGVLVVGFNGKENTGFNTISGFNEIDEVSVNNTNGTYSIFNEPDGFTVSTQFRNGPNTGIIDNVTIQSSGTANPLSNGGMLAVFTLDACSNTAEICNNNIDDDGDGAIDADDPDCFTCGNGLLTNPAFESDMTGWTSKNNSAIMQEAGGNKYLRISGGSGGVGQDVVTTPGTAYSISMYGKKNATELAWIGLTFFDADFNVIGANHAAEITTTNYQLYYVSALAPPNAAWVQAFAWKNDGAGTVDVDGFCLEEWTVTSPTCNGDSCALSPDWGNYIFSIDDSNNDLNWLDYDNGGLFLCNNGDGTLGLKGIIIGGHDATWDTPIGTICGAQDGWMVDFTLSDMQTWAEFQGSYEVETNLCPNAYQNLDYWALSGTLTGIGCNSGRTIINNDASMGYRLQIGRGGNQHSCEFGLSTWIAGTENGNPVLSDIYAHIDSTCYYSMRPATCDNLLTNEELDNGTTDWSLYTQTSNTATLSVDNTSQLSGINTALVDISAITGTDWHVQLVQTGKTIEAGKDYNISFQAKSVGDRTASVMLQRSGAPYSVYWWQEINLSTVASIYSFDLTVDSTNIDNVGFYINLGESTENIYVDSLSFKEVCNPKTTCGTIQVDNVNVSNCIDHPLMDVATLDVTISWSDAPFMDSIEVQIANQTEYISVANGVTSPHTIQFIIPADGSTNNSIDIGWKNAIGCEVNATYNAPTACSNDIISCDILYICGDDKPYDGDAWDHGWLEYIDAVNGSSELTPAFSKPVANGIGLYDPMNTNNALAINFSDYDLIIVSATTEGRLSSDLIDSLAITPVSVLNSNINIYNDLGMTASEAGVAWQSNAFIDNTTAVDIYNFNNKIDPWNGQVLLTGEYHNNADVYLWEGAGDQVAGIEGVFFNYTADDILPTIATHGDRIFLGYHMNGFYANDANGGTVPTPSAAWFEPAKHLTLEGKTHFDIALKLAAAGCNNTVPLNKDICYLISDGEGDGSLIQDTFYTFNHTTGMVTAIGPTGTFNIEAMAYDTVNQIIYTADDNDFGTIDIATGAFTAINTNMGSLNGAEGNSNINGIDGMTYDYTNNIIWATERKSSGSNGLPDDLLLKIDPITGTPLANGFGIGIGYLTIATNEHDLDDIAMAADGTLYAISNYSSSGNQRLGIINTTTGVFTEIGDYGIEDVESLTFTAEGQLLATTGENGNHANRLYSIDAATAMATLIGSIEPAHDVEACDCSFGNFINLQIGDRVWADLNRDGLQTLGEPGIEGVTVNLLDRNGNPILNELNAPRTSITDASGTYNFDRLSAGDYLIEFEVPTGTSFTTQHTGTDGAIDSDVNTSTGRSAIITLSGSTNNLDIDAGILSCEDFVTSPLPLEAITATYRTISDGNWSDIATWQNGIIPSLGDINNQIISIEHKINIQNNNVKLLGGAQLYVTNGQLTFNSGNFSIENGIATFLNSDLVIANGGNLQLVSAQSKLIAKDGFFNIGQNFQNSGGTLKLENICLIVHEVFDNTNGIDSLINVNGIIGIGSSGNFTNYAGSTTYVENASFELPNGNFDNQSTATFTGDSIKLWLQNGNLQNNGNWTLPVTEYCVSGQVTVPMTFLPSTETCLNIRDYFNIYDCLCTSQADEICNNGIDDDGDGLVDEYCVEDCQYRFDRRNILENSEGNWSLAGTHNIAGNTYQYDVISTGHFYGNLIGGDLFAWEASTNLFWYNDPSNNSGNPAGDYFIGTDDNICLVDTSNVLGLCGFNVCVSTAAERNHWILVEAITNFANQGDRIELGREYRAVSGETLWNWEETCITIDPSLIPGNMKALIISISPTGSTADRVYFDKIEISPIASPSCEVDPCTIEICDNNIDDDGDGLIDGEDADCCEEIAINVPAFTPDFGLTGSNLAIYYNKVTHLLEFEMTLTGSSPTDPLFPTSVNGSNAHFYLVLTRGESPHPDFGALDNYPKFDISDTQITADAYDSSVAGNYSETYSGMQITSNGNSKTYTFSLNATSLLAGIGNSGGLIGGNYGIWLFAPDYYDDPNYTIFDVYDGVVNCRVGEICNNNMDDDGDGLTDCEDPDCQIATITDLSFSNCIQVGNDFQSTLSVEVTWSNPPAGENIVVSANNTTQTIDIVGGATSPTMVQFTITADNSQDNPIAINYSGGGGCAINSTYNAPAPCPIPTDRDAPCDNSSGHVGGIVFEDLNGDGQQGNGEPGLAGILVTATDSTGATVGQIITNNLGVFQFETLTNGAKIRLEFTAIPTGMYPTNGENYKGTTVQFEQVPSCDAALGLIDPTENPCDVIIDGILLNGYSLVSMLPENDDITLAVKDVTQLGTLWQTAGNRNNNQAGNVTTYRTWTTADFEGSTIFSTAVDPKSGTIYAIASPLHASAANTETILFESAIAPKVFRIDAVTGIVTRIAQLPGSLGLGYIDFDAVHEQLFITNIDDGRIYRLNTDGVLLSSFDPLSADDGIVGQLPTLGDRILGVAFNPINKRVYYSVWANHYDRTNVSINVNATSNTIRSVALDASGAFIPATDQLEITMPYGASGFNLTTPVGDIVFNRAGNSVLLAEFPLGENTATSQIVTASYIGVLREYQLSAGIWNLEPTYGANDEGKYDIGNQAFYKGRNSRGGVDWAYESIAGTTINGDESYILTTGDALHINATEGDNIFGLQFLPATGGNISNSILLDMDNNLANENLYAYGDVDVYKDYCANLSLEIGNYVWLDEDEDGVQDPNELGMQGVNVSLYNAAGDSLTTVATNAEGEYYFSDAIHGLLPNTTYYLVIGKGGQFDTSLGVLNQVNNLTMANSGSGNYADWNDSDGLIAATVNGQPATIADYPFIEVQTGSIGQNEHHFDFGFRQICSAAIVLNDSLVLCPGTAYEGSVAVNDINHEDKNFTVISAPTNGTVAMNLDGTFVYNSTTSSCETDEFTYQVCDATNICCVNAIVHLNFNDTTLPSLTNIPDNDTVSCDELIPLPPQIFAIDNCPRIALDVQEESTQGEDGCSLYDYTITRTWTAIDQCGNSTSATQIIEVEDVIAPDIYRIYTMPNGKKMVAGVMELVGENWKTVSLPIDFDAEPIIFHQVVTSDAIPVISQIQNISVSQFQLRIKAEEAHTAKLTRKSIAWIAMEAGTQTTDYQLEVNSTLLSEMPQGINFQNAFTGTPALFMSSQTTEEVDPFTLRHSGLTTTGATLTLQEEASDDIELTHNNEKVGYLAIEKLGSLRETRGRLIGEVGTATINSNWTTINLNHTYHNPVIIANSLSNIDGEAATVSIRNVGLDQFEIKVNEWAYLDGIHNNETVSYIVIEGSIPLESPEYCDTGTDSLDISVDFKSVDNCDVSVVINYVEKDTFIGATKVITRTWSAEDECGNSTSYSQEISCAGVSLKLKSILQGAMLDNAGDGLMRDDLRKKELLPMEEPYAAINRFQHVAGGGGEKITDESILADYGANSIVDWVFVELRDASDVNNVIATKSALIQRDGDVVTTRGDTLLRFVNTKIGDYFVAIRHRNHLGIISLDTYTFSPSEVPFVDFTFNFTPVLGDHSSVEMDDLESLWSGDLNSDGKVIYQGPNNDIFFMFLHVLRNEANQDFLPNFISRGYTNDDFNLDGSVIYQGPSNDRARLLFSTILSHPDNSNKLSNFIIYTSDGN